MSTEIEVKLLVTGNIKKPWGVFINGNLIGRSEESFSADFWAEQFGKAYKNSIVNHYPENRLESLEVLKRIKEVVKKKKINGTSKPL